MGLWRLFKVVMCGLDIIKKIKVSVVDRYVLHALVFLLPRITDSII